MCFSYMLLSLYHAGQSGQTYDTFKMVNVVLFDHVMLLMHRKEQYWDSAKHLCVFMEERLYNDRRMRKLMSSCFFNCSSLQGITLDKSVKDNKWLNTWHKSHYNTQTDGQKALWAAHVDKTLSVCIFGVWMSCFISQETGQHLTWPQNTASQSSYSFR